MAASVSGPASAAAAAPALGAANGPVVSPDSAPALSARGRSEFVPVCAVLAAPGCPLAASVAESVAVLEAGIVASLGPPVAQAAAQGFASASVLSSGSVAALEAHSLWAPLSFGSKDQSHVFQEVAEVSSKTKTQFQL